MILLNVNPKLSIGFERVARGSATTADMTVGSFSLESVVVDGQVVVRRGKSLQMKSFVDNNLPDSSDR